ncbi:MAG: 1-deoxy-D-xylulose-5-phosphate reductoisomerase [Candidatus Latescibacteria bacterium]|nr:1-deoxy-D-xylulose-5-phosphate reductoisomerase [Candidatus Latescibacterota bacterium]
MSVFKKVAILGSTGSIGKASVEILEKFPQRFSVVALSAGRNAQLLCQQALRCRPQLVAIADKSLVPVLKQQLKALNIEVVGGNEGLTRVVEHPESTLVINALVGGVGLLPTLKAIEAEKNVALANKESFVMAGEIITKAAEKRGVKLLPIDSEMSAIWQCLNDNPARQIKRLILTASGGPFLRWPQERLKDVTPSDALLHPTWQMGKKITIDSATLMNKGLEIIEAHWFFKVPPSQINVVVHPQSTVHSMVEFIDGSILAQLGVADMRLPIQYALTYPERMETEELRLDFSQGMELTFEPPDQERFPCLKLSYRAAEIGSSMPTVLNAANEVAVEAFLSQQIRFTQISEVVEEIMNSHKVTPGASTDEILQVDSWARHRAKRVVANYQ